MTTTPDPLQTAIQAIKAGDRETGKRLLAQVIHSTPQNELAWLWMSGVVDSDDLRRQCLERVLSINPGNTLAKRGLAALRQGQVGPVVPSKEEAMDKGAIQVRSFQEVEIPGASPKDSEKVPFSSAPGGEPGPEPEGQPRQAAKSSGPAQKSKTVLMVVGLGVLLCCIAPLLGGGIYLYCFFRPYTPSSELFGIGQTHPIVYDGDQGFARNIYAMTPDGSDTALLFSFGGIEACQYPVWSPDGTKVAFVSDKDGNYEIYVVHLDGSGITNLTNHPAFDSRLDWSPDGTRIAFVSDRAEGDEIFVMNADGSNVRQLTDQPWSSYSLAWSPDGKRIAYSREARHKDKAIHSQIFVMNADGTRPIQLTHTKADNVAPAWSPDGARIAFASNRDGEWGDYQIYVMNSDGSAQTRLTYSEAWDTAPAWSPDGKQIAFESPRDENWDIYVMNADGSGRARLTKNRGYDGNPDWKP